MKITCPDCGFSRELPSDRVPAKPVIATCPHCACRFRFAPEDASSQVLTHGTDNMPGSPEEPVTPDVPPQGGDDPLPPGAIVPGASSEPFPSRDMRDRRNAHDEREDGRASAPDEAPAGSRQEGGHFWQRWRRRSAGDHQAEKGAGKQADSRYEEEHEDDLPVSDNPWDMAPYPSGYASAFYQTTLRVMFGAGRFFARLDPEAPQLRALLYYLVVVLALVITQFVWTSMSRDILEQAIAQNDSLVGQVLTFSLNHPLLFGLVSVASLVLQLYTLSALLLLGYRLAGVRDASFVIIFQIIAYSAAPVLLSIIPLLGSQVGVVWSIACIVNGCRMAFRLDWPRTLLGLMPLLLFLFVMFGSLPV